MRNLNGKMQRMNRGQSLRSRRDQTGAVLMVALIMLLVTTFVGFAAMETSNLEAKMATSREVKEQTFQTAERAIEGTLDNFNVISQAYSISLQGGNNWPKVGYDFGQDNPYVASTEVRFINNANSIGYSIRKGASGIATYYYSVEGQASRPNSNINSVHTQGVYVEGPSLN